MITITTVIVGTRFRGPDAMARLAKLAAGDVLTLRREPDNPADPGAVAVYQDGAHLGYLPRERYSGVRLALDTGKAVTCECTAEALMQDGDTAPGGLPKITVAPGGLPKIAVKWED